MLDAFIIDALRRQEEEQEQQRPRLEMPLPPPPQPTEEPIEKQPVIVIDMKEIR